MGTFVLIAAVMMSAAVLSDAGKPFEPVDLDRMPPPLPENVAVYETIGSGEPTRGSDEDPDSCTTIPHLLIAFGH